MAALSYSLIITGVALLILGYVGLARRHRTADAEPLANETDEAPETELNEVEAYHRMAKGKRRGRWAETPADSEPLGAEAQSQEANDADASRGVLHPSTPS